MTDWTQLTERCRDAMQAAIDKPGRYGGRYVGRKYDKQAGWDVFLILEDDDPATVPDDVDVLAQVMPDVVHPIGAARYYLKPTGEVEFHDSN